MAEAYKHCNHSGFTDEVIHLYLARGLKKFDQHTDEDEFIDIEAIKPEEVRRMLLDGEIFDAKTLSALCMMQLVNKKLHLTGAWFYAILFL